MLGKEEIAPNYENCYSLNQYYKEIVKVCPNLEFLPTTLRYSESASHQKIGGVMYAKGNIIKSEVKEVFPVVDRLGTGDAFMAGIIYGLIENLDHQEVLDFAVAASLYKHTIAGDVNVASLEEVHAIMKGDLSALIKR
ncbi:PfkB family carbohydrate kinase [Salegentibacter agarivorans]